MLLPGGRQVTAMKRIVCAGGGEGSIGGQPGHPALVAHGLPAGAPGHRRRGAGGL